MSFHLAGTTKSCATSKNHFNVNFITSVLNVFSDRKRMSVILRTSGGEIKLLIKGAVSCETSVDLVLDSCCLGFCDL